MKMSRPSPRVFLFMLCNLLSSSLVVHALANDTDSETQDFFMDRSRSSGKGCDHDRSQCNKPPMNPKPSSLLPNKAEILIFEDLRLSFVYPVIQKFKSIITSDPLGITKTWVGSDICSYRGFFCDNPPDNKSATALAAIDFNGFQLGAPSLDGFLDQLPDIALFHANSNNFRGTISTNITNLPYLYELDVSNNQLSGPFPTAIINMNSLTFLDIRFNFFTGSVPPQVFMQDLDFLLINNNNFMQNLPDTLSDTHILYLSLANNKFSGPIPSGIVKALSSLTEVLLLNNSLSGCLPYELGTLDEAVVFDAGNNRLTGQLPFSLSCLKNVEQLNFAGNLLFGMVPEVVCGLGKLVNLSLSDNYFTFVGPICRILIGRGVLNIKNNCIPDLPFQRSVSECARFFSFPRVCPRFWSYMFIPCMFPSFNSNSPASSIPKYRTPFP